MATRRTNQQIQADRDALFNIVAADRPMTVRQVFYRAVAAGLVPKLERGGYTYVDYDLIAMRRDGSIPYDWIVDQGRSPLEPATYTSVDEAVNELRRGYERDLWLNQPERIQIWLEKNALAGVLYPVTSELHVPLMVTVGFSSITFTYEAAQTLPTDRPVTIYHVGDHDPSGYAIGDSFMDELREHAFDADLRFQRLAVTEQQIEEMNLPTRPTKTSRHRPDFTGDSVEVDAIPPADLRDLVREAIERHIDRGKLTAWKRQQTLDRKRLDRFTES